MSGNERGGWGRSRNRLGDRWIRYRAEVTRRDEVMSDIDRVETAIEEAAQRIERAVKDSTHYNFIVYGLLFLGLVSLAKNAWHGKWRYQIEYGVGSSKVQYEKEPHNCDFLAAPLGVKYCDYEVRISTAQWATSTTGQPIVSYDDGKTWNTFSPDAGVTVPKYPTVEEVFVTWEKNEY